jgi:hypothetical protein
VCTGSASQATDLLKLNDMLQYNYADYVNQRLMSFSDVDIEQVYELYGIHSTALDPELCDATLVSDMRATCPIDEMSRVAANASRSSVYRYQVRSIVYQPILFSLDYCVTVPPEAVCSSGVSDNCFKNKISEA